MEVNAYSCKGASGRMLALFARTDDTGAELGEVERCAQRPGFAASNNRLCNLESKPFFAIFSYDLLQFIKTDLAQPLRTGWAAAGIHPHIQRTHRHARSGERRVGKERDRT